MGDTCLGNDDRNLSEIDHGVENERRNLESSLAEVEQPTETDESVLAALAGGRPAVKDRGPLEEM